MSELIERQGPRLVLRLRDPGEPTREQFQAGDYEKRKVPWKGLTLAIENEAGSIRRGRKPDGTEWATRMLYAYGEILRTEGVDGDPVDVFLGPEMETAPMVYVVHQNTVGQWDVYDEDKCMLGFLSEDEARQAFLDCYDDPRFLGPITAMPVEEFIAKAKATRTAPAMIKSVVFFKADQLHLFEKLVPVKGAVRAGKFVAPHVARRHVRAPEQHDLFAPASEARLPTVVGVRGDWAERLATPMPQEPRLVLPKRLDPAVTSGAKDALVDETPAAIPDGPDLASYDKILVAFSGGKDSIACLVAMLEAGVPKEKIELHHHDIDGEAGHGGLMDWPITRAYCKAIADAIGIPIYFSWREGGFEREMLRENSKTAPVVFETPEGELKSVGGVRGKESTRRKFPQVSADLNTRWCSGKMKIDVMDSLIANQARFDGKRLLVVTGERAQESANRAKYQVFEPHRTHAKTKRHADAYRPVHAWTEGQVWGAMKRHGIVPHPAYQLGYGRLSCRTCIFGGDDQWATTHELYPHAHKKVGDYEKEFGVTIHRKMNVDERAERGTPYDAAVKQPGLARLADQHTWDPEMPVIIAPTAWHAPAGAFGENDGPC